MCKSQTYLLTCGSDENALISEQGVLDGSGKASSCPTSLVILELWILGFIFKIPRAALVVLLGKNLKHVKYNSLG